MLHSNALGLDTVRDSGDLHTALLPCHGIGVGLSVAVLLAGILVVTLAPAALLIFGRAAWWPPR